MSNVDIGSFKREILNLVWSGRGDTEDIRKSEMYIQLNEEERELIDAFIADEQNSYNEHQFGENRYRPTR